MGHDFGNPNHAMTRHDYNALEAAGKLTRPVTDGPIHISQKGVQVTPQTPTKGKDTPGGGLS